MSAPPAPDHRPLNPDMAQHQHEPHLPQEPSNVRHIPIFVEGRDEPVINKEADHKPYAGAEPKQTYAPPPQHPQPHIDRDAYFADDGPSFHHPTNFSRAFGTPYKGFRQGPQPFVQQKVYPQAAYNRGASPQRSQSPKHPQEEHYVKVPVHHAEAPAPPPKPQAQAAPQPQAAPAPPPPQREPTPPAAAKPAANDPKAQILSIQADVLDLMNQVENFTGTKKDKTYLLLDEMLTRNLIKLDDIETGGKENIRQARKEAVRCIEKCIAVLESKAEQGSNAQRQDFEMKDNVNPEATPVPENGEVEMKEENTEPQEKVETQKTDELPQNDAPNPEDKPNTEQPAEAAPVAEAIKPSEQNEQNVENKQSTTKKVVKKRDKSKDKAPVTPEAAKDSNKETGAKIEVMQVENNGEKEQVMQVDGAASQ